MRFFITIIITITVLLSGLSAQAIGKKKTASAPTPAISTEFSEQTITDNIKPVKEKKVKTKKIKKKIQKKHLNPCHR